MGNREYYEKKLEVISTIEDSQIKKPHHIPVFLKDRQSKKLSSCFEFFILII
jgi:hypothetical protein